MMCRSLNISRQFTELVIHGGERMIEKIIWIAGIFVLSGAFWYCIFYQKEKKRNIDPRLSILKDYKPQDE